MVSGPEGIQGEIDVQAVPLYNVKLEVNQLSECPALLAAVFFRLVLNFGSICTEHDREGAGIESGWEVLFALDIITRSGRR
jgi:hypothetical protein